MKKIVVILASLIIVFIGCSKRINDNVKLKNKDYIIDSSRTYEDPRNPGVMKAAKDTIWINKIK